jgi:hypothetical protein
MLFTTMAKPCQGDSITVASQSLESRVEVTALQALSLLDAVPWAFVPRLRDSSPGYYIRGFQPSCQTVAETS